MQVLKYIFLFCFLSFLCCNYVFCLFWQQRGSVGGSAGVHDTVVNQLLTKMDGVNSLNNILVIGMTNRKELIDDALLRPGRFEVHVEIVRFVLQIKYALVVEHFFGGHWKFCFWT